MTTSSSQPRTLHLCRINFAALLSAVPCARMFAGAVLHHWNLADVTDEVKLITSELVSNAVQATGILRRALIGGLFSCGCRPTPGSRRILGRRQEASAGGGVRTGPCS